MSAVDTTPASGSATEAERHARMALASVVEPGEPRVSALVAERGAEEVWQAVRARTDGSVWARRAALYDERAASSTLVAAGARFVVPGDPEWPQQLADLAGCEPLAERGGVPLGLWVRGRGRLDELCAGSVAVVGARAATSYGQGVAQDMAYDLAGQRVGVVSGGAFGIDAAAHRGALAAGGATVAVLASGVDVAYPRANQALFSRVEEQGLLVSEHPPGEHPTKIRFLGRNRLIAALAAATVVVEATARSGARNTASWASRCGRVLAAVPGSVHSAQSVTPHRLIADGEGALVTGAADVLALLAPLEATRPAGGGHRQHRLMDGWEPETIAVREALPARGGLTASEVSLRSGLDVPDCLAQLAWLEQEGHVVCSATGEWHLERR